MQSKFGSHGLPLCLSGFSLSHPSLSTEMADHDRRREAMRSQRSSASREIAFTRNMEGRLFEDGDLDETNLTCAAKAA